MPRFVRVAVPVPLHRLFDYLPLPGPWPPIGARVLVPFGRRRLVGVVVEYTDASDQPEDSLKPVIDVLDRAALLPDELLATLRWASRYYQHAIGEVIEAALPVALRGSGSMPADAVTHQALTDAGHAALGDPRRRRGTKIDALLSRLGTGAVATERLDIELPGWRIAARSLRERGWIRGVIAEAMRPGDRVGEAGPALNAEQGAASAAILASADRFTTFLLDGVTGSGKTEVYLHAILDVVARGRQALVLVPEIALTPQTVRRFRERLGFEVATLHSGLADGERARAWLAAARGEAAVVLGTRSAVFVPLARPGLIVIDEEHDASYKQHDGFRYHARDLAVVRAKALAIPVVLGSATPSLESLANVESGRYARLVLRARAGVAQPPALRVMDIRHKRLEYGLAIDTLQAIGRHVGEGGQVLVFRNRRGYAPVLFCHACGWTAQCTRCERPMTVHRGTQRLSCHHCGFETRLPSACPECASTALAPQGQGTERLEETLVERFPDVPVVRVDRDSTRSRGRRDAVFAELGGDGPRIFVGTQMLAKGHDLAALTLVVVVGVDEGLYSIDFRAGERLGQLVMQVAGRAGRAARPGEVILQTHHPQHPLLLALLEGGYPALAARLLDERRAAQLPPFGHLALVRAEARSASEAMAFLRTAQVLAGAVEGVSVHPPMQAPMPRRAGYERAQLLVEGVDRARLHAFLGDWLVGVRTLPAGRRVRWSVDVDPIELS